MKKILFFILLIFASACSPLQTITRKEKKNIQGMIERSPVFSGHFTGFVLYDPGSKETLVSRNAHRYFTPASNTKILTFYTALEVLGDSVALFEYAKEDSTYILRGSANPIFLHSDFEQFPLPDFLFDKNYKIAYSPDNYRDGRFGEGWMWDDYIYNFQTEKSSFPIYTNNVQVTLPLDSDAILIAPDYFSAVFTPLEEKGERFSIVRDEKYNFFHYQLPKEQEEKIEKHRPFITSPAIVSALLSDTLGRKVEVWHKADSLVFEPYLIPMQDTIYRKLLHESDNFIAEQLLLMCSQRLFGYQNTQEVIAYAKDSLFSNLSDELLWVDGSGISRYNLFTPASLVEILDNLQRKIPFERLSDLFPTGGKSGTMSKWYKNEKPYVFAKTGTLRNNHNISGYLVTKSNRLLIFSFMNNHFKGDSSRVKEEMEKVLFLIYRSL